MKKIVFLLFFIPFIGFSQIPITDDNIYDAVGLWTSNQSDAEDAYGHISNWDVSSVTNMQAMFSRTSFNQDIGNWDVSNVTNMSEMFSSASFNQDIGNWDVSNVTNMVNMFRWADSFNQNIGSWDVENVQDCQTFCAYAASWALPKPNFSNCGNIGCD